MICIDDARLTAREMAAQGCSTHAILSQLYTSFDGFRFYEHKGKIWMEGDDTYIPAQELCVMPK